jgi:hypothetical protein
LPVLLVSVALRIWIHSKLLANLPNDVVVLLRLLLVPSAVSRKIPLLWKKNVTR